MTGKWRDQSFLPKVSITNTLARWKIFPRVTTLSPSEYFFFLSSTSGPRLKANNFENFGKNVFHIDYGPLVLKASNIPSQLPSFPPTVSLSSIFTVINPPHKNPVNREVFDKQTSSNQARAHALNSQTVDAG